MLHHARICISAIGVLCGLMVLVPTRALPADSPVRAKAGCDSLQGRKIAPSMIGLPTTGASVTSATLIAAKEQAGTDNRTTLAIPEYCKVIGVITPVDQTAPLINFQVNLPTAWNRKAIQLGGSGLNGMIPLALTIAPQIGPETLPPNSPYAISRGFVVYGSDSGHQMPQADRGQGSTGDRAGAPEGRGAPPLQDGPWMSNREALENLAYGQMKKTHDVAWALIKLLHGRTPRHSYYMGSSQGGREALMVAQRFPKDYDGVFSQVPIFPYAHLMMDTTLRARLQTGDGWIPPAKVAVIAKEVARQCDELDGSKDGLVANYIACNDRFDPAINPNALAAVRCCDGKDTGDECMSDAQIKAANQVHSNVVYPFPLYKGWTTFPGWTTGSESAGNWKTFQVKPGNMQPGGATLRTFAKGAEINMDTLLEDYRTALQELSATFDASDPDLSAFRKRGGKLIMKVNTADYAANPRWSYAYYNKMIETMGKSAVQSFARLYVSVGLFHNGNNGRNPITNESIPKFIDFIAMLDDWVDRGKPPGDRHVVADMKSVPPFDIVSSLPLCHYPTYPRYSGHGDSKKAENYSCAAP